MARPVDPDDATAVGEAFAGELRRYGLADAAPVRRPEPIAEATSTWVFFVDLRGPDLPDHLRGPLVLRVYRPTEMSAARTEHDLATFLERHRYPVPRCHLLGDGDGPLGLPWLLQERCPGRSALDAVAAAPWTLRRTTGDLAALEARLHALPSDGCPLPSGTPISESYLAEDLDRRRGQVEAVEPTDGLGWLHATAPEFADRETVICHGDFHPLNVLVDRAASPPHYSVIDWTDAALGDPHFDVARSLAIYWVAGVAAPTPAQRRLLGPAAPLLRRRHRSAYRAAGGRRLEDRRLAWWEAVHLYRGWLQLAEVAEGAVTGPDGSTRTGMPADLPDRLLGRFHAIRRALD